MAVSSADMRSALSLPAAVPNNPTKKTAPGSGLPKKPDGIPRELYALIGDSTPMLATQLAKPRLKQKPKLGGGSKSTWYDNNASVSCSNSPHEQGMAPVRQPSSEGRFTALSLGESHWRWLERTYGKITA